MVFGVLVSLIGFYMIFGKFEWCLGDYMFKGVKVLVILLFIGFLLVLMGIGGGSFGVFIMILFGVLIYCVVVMVVGFGVIIVVLFVVGFLIFDLFVGVVLFFIIGVVNLLVFFIVIVMIILIVFYGVILVYWINVLCLKKIFGVFLIFVVLNMLCKVIGL